MEIRVAIFEDNKLVRDALQTILNGTDGFICTGAFADGKHWLQDVRRSDPNVILMDIEMPGVNGIELSRLVLNEFSTVKILIQTVFNDGSKIFNALCAGASGYILKNDPPHRYVEAIREVYGGGSPMNPTVARKVLGFFTNKNIILVAPGNTDYDLSDREKEILKLMVEGHHLKSIADATFISYETVRTHVKHIYKKLHVVCRNEAVMKAVQQELI
jgi:DNA-binding NarL/FixJ family response regulator